MDSIDEVRNALDRGELFTAYDLAEQALEKRPHDLRLQYLAVLALVRARAVDHAVERFRDFELGNVTNSDAPLELKTDIASLHGRLAKDLAFAEVDPAKRLPLLTDAAQIYSAIYKETGSWFPGINAATISLLAGDNETASRLAGEVLTSCEGHQPKDGTDTYYLEATRAEAALVLGQERAAAMALERAAMVTPRNYGAVATTRRQLRLVCQKRGVDLRILDALRVPCVLHFVSSGRNLPLDGATEQEVSAQVLSYLSEWNVGFGYGSLTSWEDVIAAESLLACGAELQVVLPFAAEELRRLAFDPLGDSWSTRFDRCLARASGSPAVMTEEYLDDDHVFTHVGEVAMGLAVLRSQFLQTDVRQLAICTESNKSSFLDTGAGWDVTLPRHVIETKAKAQPEERRDTSKARHSRRLAALVFGDIKGFSKLRESQIPTFMSEIMGRVAAVLEGYAERILYRNTWGDGFYLVLSDVAAAACLATDLQSTLQSLDRVALGLPRDLDLRIGLHAGPVFEVLDPVLGRPAFMGSNVNRTARIEPATPPGQVYVSEPFAARVALQPRLGFECEYVGQVPAAKDFGKMRMYSLKRTGWSVT